jgi:acetyl esterase/lipase
MTTTYPESPGTHMIVLPGGGYAAHAPHEAEPVASWLSEIGMQASVFRYPLNVRHPAPLDALRAEIRRRRADGAQRIGLIGFSAGGHLAGLAALAPGAAADQTYRPARLILLGEDPYVPSEHTYRFAAALAASRVSHAVHVFAHGPHGLGLAQGAGQTAIWTTPAEVWIRETAASPG